YPVHDVTLPFRRDFLSWRPTLKRINSALSTRLVVIKRANPCEELNVDDDRRVPWCRTNGARRRSWAPSVSLVGKDGSVWLGAVNRLRGAARWSAVRCATSNSRFRPGRACDRRHIRARRFGLHGPIPDLPSSPPGTNCRAAVLFCTGTV